MLFLYDRLVKFINVTYDCKFGDVVKNVRHFVNVVVLGIIITCTPLFGLDINILSLVRKDLAALIYSQFK